MCLLGAWQSQAGCVEAKGTSDKLLPDANLLRVKRPPGAQPKTDGQQVFVWGAARHGMGKPKQLEQLPFRVVSVVASRDGEAVIVVDTKGNVHELTERRENNAHVMQAVKLPQFGGWGTQVREVAFTEEALYALTTSGTVYAVALSRDKESKLGARPATAVSLPRGLRGPVKLCAGSKHVALLTSRGEVFTLVRPFLSDPAFGNARQYLLRTLCVGYQFSWAVRTGRKPGAPRRSPCARERGVARGGDR